MLDSAFWQGRRVLLTGHTGFKGAWLLLWLQKLGASVWGYALEADPAPNLFRQLAKLRSAGEPHGWQHEEGDLADLSSLKKLVDICQPEVVLHLAAQPLVRRSYRDPLGTWATNVQGSLHLLEALKPLEHHCAVVMVTTDKVYENREWPHGYRECDRLGGHDPYSASKAAAELAIASWRASFCGTAVHQTPHLRIATARAGNVIGGGDWAEDRIVPDAMRALAAGKAIAVRRPDATRPWQHVLEPLGGYLLLAELLAKTGHAYASAFNFGPNAEANRSVQELVDEALRHWPGSWSKQSAHQSLHEAGLLQLEISKARQQLGWQPRWDFATTVELTVEWYRKVHEGACPIECCLADLKSYSKSIKDLEFSQA
jgi:CDP-glucose 4,6-dehydratase